MDRRKFLSASGAVGFGSMAAGGFQEDPKFTAGSGPGPVLAGSPVVAGPGHDAITILQPLQRHATGFLEYAVGNEAFQRVDAETAGMRPFEAHVLKFRLPRLPPGKEIRYKITARSIGWVQVREFFHGEVRAGEPETGAVRTFRTLDPAAESTTFAVWNDTHENAETLKTLHARTEKLKPDFLLWNGDQSNDVHFEKDMAGQFLAPAGLAIADRWPMAYVRGNHDVRGPEAHAVPKFTGTPDDRFYYAFRSGPLAALVMDTGEDKPDESPVFHGLIAFQAMQRRQLDWLKGVVKKKWFRDAPFKLLFCHIPLYFTRDIYPTHQRWECHHFCRELWLPTLQDAGVKLIVSGHTHDPRWMPAKEGQPIAQLIGGGPQPRAATFIQGSATRKNLELSLKKLDGKAIAEVKFDAA